jgi:hypothetical protein
MTCFSISGVEPLGSAATVLQRMRNGACIKIVSCNSQYSVTLCLFGILFVTIYAMAVHILPSILNTGHYLNLSIIVKIM